MWKFLIVVMLLSVVSTGGPLSENASRGNRVVIMLDRTCDGSLSVRLNGQAVELGTALNVLGDLLQDCGSECPVFVLAHERTSIGDLTTIRGMANKVGFIHVRFFYFGDDRRMMAEIVMEKPAVPYTETPQE